MSGDFGKGFRVGLGVGAALLVLGLAARLLGKV